MNKYYQVFVELLNAHFSIFCQAKDSNQAEEIAKFLLEQNYTWDEDFKLEIKSIKTQDIEETNKIYFIVDGRLKTKSLFNKDNYKSPAQIACESYQSEVKWKDLDQEVESNYKDMTQAVLMYVLEQMVTYKIPVEKALALVMNDDPLYCGYDMSVSTENRRPECKYCHLRHWPGETSFCAY